MKANKQLKEAYRQIKFKVGVFQIRNTANGKIFVGSSVNLEAIWNRIKSELKFAGHRNLPLQTDWNLYGEECFLFEILSEIKQEDGDQADYNKEVKILEGMFIDELQPFADKGYNKQSPLKT